MFHVSVESCVGPGYVRDDDDAVMIEDGPGRYVNRDYYDGFLPEDVEKPERRSSMIAMGGQTYPAPIRYIEASGRSYPNPLRLGNLRYGAAHGCGPRNHNEAIECDRPPQPDARPGTLPGEQLGRINAMLAQEQISGRQHTAAIRYMIRPDYLGPLHHFVDRILFRKLSAERLADPRVGRTRGIGEVMRRFREGLDVLVEHYRKLAQPKPELQTPREGQLRLLRRLQVDRAKRISRARRKSKFPIPYGPPIDFERAKWLSYLEARERSY